MWVISFKCKIDLGMAMQSFVMFLALDFKLLQMRVGNVLSLPNQGYRLKKYIWQVFAHTQMWTI